MSRPEPGGISAIGRARRRAAVGVVVVVAAALAMSPTRALIVEAVPLGVRHALVSAYSWLLPPVEETADLIPLPHVDVNPYGVNVFLEQEVEEVKVRRSLEMIRAAGFGWIKQQLLWSEVEVPGKGRFIDRATGGSSWAKYDRIADLAAEHGLGVIFRIDTSPEWARPGRTKIETPPANIADYGDFVALVAERYRGRVAHFQIWNEPNLPFEWGGDPPDAAAYTRLLEQAYRRIREAHPDAVVLSAALAPTTEYSEHGINDLIYLQQMYDAGVRGNFDVLAANAYGLRSGPDDRRLGIDRDVNFSRPLLVRQVMVRNGDAGRPIWAAEVGWNALPPDYPAIPLFGRVDRETQAAYSARAFRRAQEEWPWMGVMNLWHFRLVSPGNEHLQQYYFNMVDEQFRPFPLYQAMSDLTRRPRLIHRGYRQESNPAMTYHGEWRQRSDARAVLSGYREARAAGAIFEAPFLGTEVDLVVDTLPGGGVIDISLDGSARSLAVDLETAVESWGVRVPVASGLPDGVHVLTARTRDERPVRLDGLIVERRRGWPGTAPESALLIMGAVAALVCGVRASTNRAA